MHTATQNMRSTSCLPRYENSGFGRAARVSDDPRICSVLKFVRLGELALVHFLEQIFRLFFQHEGKHLLGHRIIPYGSERLPMQRRRPVLAQGSEVMRRAVSLVRSQAVEREDRS